MCCAFSLVLLLNSLFLIPYAKTQNPGNCSSEGKPLHCCPNYRRRGDTCEECWPGTYGIDCKEDCPHAFYGRFCGEKCNCSSCDKVSGCQSETTNQDSPYTECIIIASSLAGSLTFVLIFIAIYCKLRNRASITPTSVIYKGGEQASVIPLNECPHINPSSGPAADGGDPESTLHGREWETLDRQICSQQNDFADNSTHPKENSQTLLSTSDNVYNHLNMDVDQYHILGMTLSNSQETDEELYSVQNSIRHSTNTGSWCSLINDGNGCLFSEKDCSEKVNECSQIGDEFETQHTQETENIKIGMTKKDPISSVKLKIEPRCIEELSRKLHSFKLKPVDM